MAGKNNFRVFGSIQSDFDDFLEWDGLSNDDFIPVDQTKKENLIVGGESVSHWGDVWCRLRENTAAMVAVGVLVLLFLFAILGPIVVPYSHEQRIPGAENLRPWHVSLADQQRLNDEMSRQAPGETEAAVRRALGIKAQLGGYSNEELEKIEGGEKVFPHLLGTDKFGHDILVRVMVGTRVSMLVGIFAALLVLLVGTLYGSVSGYIGGSVDMVMQHIAKIVGGLPEVLVILLVSIVLGDRLKAFMNSGEGFLQQFVGALSPNLLSMFIAFGLVYWVAMSRMIRDQVIQIKEMEYVTASQALGASGGHIIRRHLLPNCAGKIVVATCLQIPSAIFLESFLSFLGAGVSDPLTSLGAMASEALSGPDIYPYRLMFPAIILSVMLLSFNLLGNGLRDALDPSRKK